MYINNAPFKSVEGSQAYGKQLNYVPTIMTRTILCNLQVNCDLIKAGPLTLRGHLKLTDRFLTKCYNIGKKWAELATDIVAFSIASRVFQFRFSSFFRCRKINGMLDVYGCSAPELKSFYGPPILSNGPFRRLPDWFRVLLSTWPATTGVQSGEFDGKTRRSE